MPKKTTRKAESASPLLAARTWAILGVALVGGVVIWKLAGSSYRSDIQTICEAEKGSGLSVEKDMAKVRQWVRAHLATPEGNEFFSSLDDSRVAERAKRLQAEATIVQLGSCPMAASYELVAAQGDYRSDLQHLCSNAAFPRLVEQDDAGRLTRLLDWIDAQAKSPRTKELSAPLRQAGTGAERAKLLRETAGKMDVYSCDSAKTLESAQQAPPPAGVPTVRVAATPQIIGPIKDTDLARAVADVTPSLDDCYKKALERTPTLTGKLAAKIEVDPDGKVTRAVPADVALTDRDAVSCILQALRSLKLPKNPGPLASILLPFELTTGSPATPGTAPSAPAPSSGSLTAKVSP
jgi:hypothetical protein